MRIDILTLFPGAFGGALDVSILGRARAAGLFSVHFTDIREFATDKHRSVDDYPFGGGQGMVMRADVLDAALHYAQGLDDTPATVIAMTPQGETLTDALVRELSKQPRLILVCGRYEGMDERFLEHRVDREVSIGDYVLTGGELPAMVLIDAVVRHIAGVLGDEQSPEDESFADGLLEQPQYTRPAEYNGWRAPDVLMGGNHAAIEEWRAGQRLARTRARRPDLLERAPVPDASPPRGRSAARIRIREASLPGELDTIVAFWKAAGDGLKLGTSDTPEELSKLDPELFLVAEGREGIVGTVIGGFDGRRGYAYHLVVATKYRGRKAGEALMTELESRLKVRGCVRMNVHVVAGNWPAMRFYERLGWERLSASVYGREL